MRKWLRRIRGAVGMGLTWAVSWTVIGMVGVVIAEMLFGLDTSVVDVWVGVFAYPGFIGGVVFSTVLGIAARYRRFDEISVPRFAAWGALAGLLAGLLPNALVLVGLAQLTNPAENIWLTTSIMSGSMVILTSVSATGSLALARMAEGRALPKGGEPIAEVELTGDEARELQVDPSARALVRDS